MPNEPEQNPDQPGTAVAEAPATATAPEAGIDPIEGAWDIQPAQEPNGETQPEAPSEGPETPEQEETPVADAQPQADPRDAEIAFLREQLRAGTQPQGQPQGKQSVADRLKAFIPDITPGEAKLLEGAYRLAMEDAQQQFLRSDYAPLVISAARSGIDREAMEAAKGDGWTDAEINTAMKAVNAERAKGDNTPPNKALKAALADLEVQKRRAQGAKAGNNPRREVLQKRVLAQPTTRNTKVEPVKLTDAEYEKLTEEQKTALWSGRLRRR